MANHKRFFRLAGNAACLKSDPRNYFLGAVGIRNDGVIVISRNIISDSETSYCHAETKLVKKLDKGAIVYVARVLKLNGSFANARPCVDCIRAMKRKNVKRVYYTISDDKYGVLDLT